MARRFASGDSINFGTSDLVGAHHAWTVCLWVGPTNSVGTTQALFAKRDALSVGGNQFSLTTDIFGRLIVAIDNLVCTFQTGLLNNNDYSQVGAAGDASGAVAMNNGTITSTSAGGETLNPAGDCRSGSGTGQTIQIGRLLTEATQPYDGDICEVAVWNARLTTAELTAYYRRFCPLLIRPSALVFYAPLFGRSTAENDLVKARVGTLSGTTHRDHGAVIRPAHRRLSYLPSTPIPPPPPFVPPVATVVPMRRVRQAPHLWDGASGNRVTYPGFQLLFEAGGPRDGLSSAPLTLFLQWSDDGGHTWGALHPIEAGAVGQYRYRAIWRRLGQSRDRVFRVVESNSAKMVLLDALLDPDPIPGAN